MKTASLLGFTNQFQSSKYNRFYLRVYPSCKITIGINRSIIIDTQRKKLHFIPNSLAKILNEDVFKYSIKKLIDKYKEELYVFEEYLKFLYANNIIFVLSHNELKNYIVKDEQWDYPALITNSIVCFSTKSNYSIRKVITSLDNLQIPILELRYFCFNKLNLVAFIRYIEKSSINSFSIITSITNEKIIDEIISSNQVNKLSRIIYFSAPNDNITKMEKYGCTKIYSKNIPNSSSCGLVDVKYFSLNNTFYNEAREYNSCLNRKVSIDENGDIKNCPSFNTNYGNIKNTELENVVLKNEFQKFWHINKNLIKVCKTCEFRFVCTDCRAYIENPIDVYSKPLKCGYDPVSGVWEEWSTNPLKQSVINQYGIVPKLKS